MLNPLSVGNVRVSAEYSNAAPLQPTFQSYRQPGNSITPGNPRCSAHEIVTSEEISLSPQLVNAVGNSSFHHDLSTLQPHICEDSTDGFEGNIFFDPIDYPYQEDTIHAQNLPQARYFGPLSENFLTGSPARFMQAIPGRPKTRAQLSVGALFHTPGPNNLASAGDESSVPPLVMGYQMFSPNFHPGNNLHGINTPHVIGSEEFEQFYSPDKMEKHLVGVPSPFLPRNSRRYTSEESRATSTQCSPPSPLKIWWNLALQHLQGKELLVRCRSSATISCTKS